MSDVTVGIICLIVGFAVGAFVLYLFRKNQSNSGEEMTKVVEQRLAELLPVVLNQANENLVRMANEKLGSETKQNRMELESKREEITRMVKDLENYVKTAEKERIDSYATLKNSVEESRKVTEKLSVSTENLKKLLSDNSIRGQFGEKVAEDLLKMAGFVNGVDYEFNKKQDDSGTRPDFAIFLPDKTRINVDSKFPYANLRNMTETEDKGMKKKYMKDFEKDVKEKIKQVTTRDYINPEDKTVDFVILFVPNEMIFSFIYDKMPKITEEAMANRVILAGPFSFTAILRMVKQAYENFRVQKNIYNIIGHVKAFEKEFGTFSDSFFKIGDRIEALQKQYDTVSTTRFNQLTRRMDQVKLEGIEEENIPVHELSDPEDNQGRLLE